MAIHVQNVTNLTLPVLFTPLGTGDDPANDSIPVVRALTDSTWPSGLQMHARKHAEPGHLAQHHGATRNLYRLARDGGVVFTFGEAAGVLVVTDLAGNVVHLQSKANRATRARWSPTAGTLTPGTYVYRFIAGTGRESLSGRFVLLP
jgi:hypothetical protein